MASGLGHRIPDSIAAQVAALRGRRVPYLLGVALAAAHLWFNSLGTIGALQLNMLHFAGFVLLCALLRPLASSPAMRTLDWLFATAVVLATGYLALAEDAIHQRGLHLAAADWVAGGLVIVGAIEYSRRATGWIIPLLILLALSYLTWWGALVPGLFRFAGLSPETVMFRSIYGDDALFGSIARISATFVFLFILFGAFLVRSGAGDFIVRLADAIAGRVTGGPGVIAVVASGLTGTISGSAIANTASTGVITIPLMKKAGYPPRFAAAIEAAASTGGQLMPPIMGAGAFVMASYTEIPYATIVLVSVIPALLYFASLLFYVRFEAARQGIRPAGSAPSPRPSLARDGISFVVPVALLVGLLVAGYTPVLAAVAAIAAVVVSSWLTRYPMGPRAVFDALAMGAHNMVTTAVLLCAVGLVVNVIATAGVGNTFSLMVTDWAGGSLLAATVLVALASLLLGMGLPVTAAYIVLATLSAPALYQLMADAEVVTALAAGGWGADVGMVLSLALPPGSDPAALSAADAPALVAGLPDEVRQLLRPMLVDQERLVLALLSAHMVVFWLSQDSNVTPPVCLCSFTAASIAGTAPMATGLSSWKVAKALYLMPLLFVFTPLLTGTWAERIETGLFALFGLYAFTAAVQGWERRRLAAAQRLALAACALALLWPAGRWLHLGAAALLFAFLADARRR